MQIKLFTALYIFLEVCLIVNLGCLLFTSIIKFFLITKKKEDTYSVSSEKEPFFSIHLPICNEPPFVVKKTINSILEQNYSNYELIVLSNNTKDKEAWKPVESFCRELNNDKVQFIHVDTIAHFKAGALNYCLKYTNTAADFIFTLDSDYVLEKNSLSTAVDLLQKNSVEILQFPQNYFNHNHTVTGLATDFKNYFDTYATAANIENLSLPTGTLTIVKKEVLSQLGGWPIQTITEDAELGIKILSEKYKSLYSHQVIGSGIMPTSYKELKKQRCRWIKGNAHNILMHLFKPQLSFRKKIYLLGQLTAWLNWLGIPYISWFFLFIFSILTTNHFHFQLSALLIAGSIIIHLLSHTFLLLQSIKKPVEIIQSLMVHISLSQLGAFEWWKTFFTSRYTFHRTDKSGKSTDNIVKSLLFPFSLLLTSSFLYQFSAGFYTFFLFFYSVSFIISRMWLQYELRLANRLYNIKYFS